MEQDDLGRAQQHQPSERPGIDRRPDPREHSPWPPGDTDEGIRENDGGFPGQSQPDSGEGCPEENFVHNHDVGLFFPDDASDEAAESEGNAVIPGIGKEEISFAIDDEGLANDLRFFLPSCPLALLPCSVRIFSVG